MRRKTEFVKLVCPVTAPASANSSAKWHLIRNTFKTSPVAVVYLEEFVSAPSTQTTKAVNPLVKAQQADESSIHVREGQKRMRTPQNELQGLPFRMANV